MTLLVQALPGGVGAEVIGLDLERPLSVSVTEELNRAWLDHAIVLFRGIGTSPERQLALSRCFGELEIHPIENIRVEGHPELIWLSNKYSKPPVYYYDDVPTVSRIPWHTDLIYTTTPNRGALLRMVEKPATSGMTGWVDTARAYDGLSPEMKVRIDDLEARYEFILNVEDMRFGRPNVRRAEGLDEGEEKAFYPDFPDIAHPLVWTHPVSGRKSLCVAPLFVREIIGLEKAEGDALLAELVAHATSPEYSYWHDWAPNDMVLWDNWRTMHSTSGHPPEQSRLVHRTTIPGNHAFGRVLD